MKLYRQADVVSKAVSKAVEILRSVMNLRLNEKFKHVISMAFLGGGEIWYEDYSHLQLASTRPPFDSMCGANASRSLVKRSLNCKKITPQWHGSSSVDRQDDFSFRHPPINAINGLVCHPSSVREDLVADSLSTIESTCVIIPMI